MLSQHHLCGLLCKVNQPEREHCSHCQSANECDSQGQHEEGQQAGQHRLTIPQAAYLTIVAATIISPLQYRDNAKGSQVHEGIAEQVEKDSRESNCASYNNTY